MRLDLGQLSPADEDEVRKIVRKNALLHCKPVVEDYVECVKPRLISMIWHCGDKKNEMLKCLGLYSKQRDYDLARDEYIAILKGKRKAREAARHTRQPQENF
ncbi:hypothetical protein NEOLI_002242 [Neolecta irregularis DAH-3]|uniref:COX assembly mitochondrial protein n=1 Tax=Neolecta irregularis (strain DAH-3) TaxID=1198029 RepID=A0A1U7LTG3_NEOID|nr:hypothetical protein NEOLI_002242 [Neolecta irregularis DAH-3]|eukprot:OLL25934.1 hypothetical protein NEOLI_002242 [Neolecta irregularis DAH-3]